MHFHEFITFASDAEILALWGAGFRVVALVAMVAERRRLQRARIDRVGWVPWTGIFLATVVIGLGLLALALPSVFKG